MAFEAAEQEQPHEGFILAVEFEHLESQRAKEGFVVFATGGFGKLRFQALVCLADFEIEDGGIEIVFGGEVTKDDGFADACTVGNLFGRRAAKAFLRKQLGSDHNDLIAPLFGRHPARMCPLRRALCHIRSPTARSK